MPLILSCKKYLEELFDSNKYAKEFAKKRYVMSPSLFRQIYLGALGEVVGREIIKREVALDLEELDDVSFYEYFDFKIGKIKNTNQIAETMGQEFEAIEIPSDAKYIVRVAESSEKFRPIWCALNGFWWWRFNMSIVDNESDQEILTWSGRGCASSTARLFERILNELEK